MVFQHVYGPVPSQRLGQSLGVSPIPFGFCSYSCIYCQLGGTIQLTDSRRDYVPPQEILEEIEAALARHSKHLDCITFVGDGEPTLCSSLGNLIARTKAVTGLPIAVITNGSLLSRDDVRRELVSADLVLPSLDAATQTTFEEINRPHGRLRIADILAGMERFREMYEGKLWVEVMLVAGVNDGEESLGAIRKALDRIRPDRIDVNAPIRPPAVAEVRPPDTESLARARRVLGVAARADHPEADGFGAIGCADPLDSVVMILRRHPMREEEVFASLAQLPAEAVRSALIQLETSHRIQRIEYRGTVYYTDGKGRYERGVRGSTHAERRGASAGGAPRGRGS